MNILCTICARKGSKGLRNKALKIIHRKPLISYTIRQAIVSNQFDKVIISTDSKKIQNIAKKYGAESWFLRPKHLSNDYASKLEAIKHCLIESEKFFQKKFDICVDLDITSPLRKIIDIKKSINKFKKSKSEVLFSVSNAKKNPYFNMVEIKNGQLQTVKKKKLYRRQDAPDVFDINASIYIYKRNFLFKKNLNLFNSKKIITYLMPKNRSIDIDDIYDFDLVKVLLKYDKKLFTKI